MSKRNEDSVERFFRKATSHYDNRFVEQDWQNMEKLLDQEAATRAALKTKRLKRAAFAGAALTGIIVLVYFLALDQNHPESRLLTDETSSPKQLQAAAGAEAPIQEQKKENPSAALLFPNKDQPAVKFEESATGLKKPAQQAASNNPQRRSAEEIQTGQPAKSENPPQLATVLNKEEVPSTAVAAWNPSEKITAENITEKEAVKPEEVLENTAETQRDPHPQEESEKEKKEIVVSRWNVALAISPDFSTTELTQYSSPGTAFGLTLGYRILPRLTFTTGVLKSSKKYESNGNEYQPPEGYWQRRTNGVVPDHIHGRCKVVEIPVMIQYNILQREKSRAFASVGVSSYLMLSEAYDYTFTDPNPGAAPGWRSPGSSSHLFDIGHVSLGYERQVTPAISVGLEPFFNLPLVGIGWSRLDLFTTGAYVNIRYRILKKAIVLSGVTKK